MRVKIRKLKKKLKLNKYPDLQKHNKIRQGKFSEYRKKYIGPYSQNFKGYKNLVKGAERYDAVMVGSDQLWTPAGIKSKFYNLIFVPEGIRKISFATSFGVSSVPKNQKNMTAFFLNRIDYLSVREVAGAKLIHELTGREAVVALDPTLLLTGEEWKAMFPEKKIVEGDYIFAYL